MKNENKRVFISDLPETVTRDELLSNFSKYGKVSSVEIKERKELGLKNKSLFFAYVNLITGDKGINHCFRELSNTEWHGQHVQLQIAKESFLERLKREREESLKSCRSNSSDIKEVTVKPVTTNNLDFSKIRKTTVKESGSIDKRNDTKHNFPSETEGDSSESESIIENYLETNEIEVKTQNTKIEVFSEPEEKLDIVIKSNKGKIFDKSGLKIPSVGKEPIVKITKTKNKSGDSEANLKRLQSLRDMRKSYAAQKSFIKNSLSYVINKPNTKIVFDDNEDEPTSARKTNGLQKNSLFEDRSDDSDFEVVIEVKEQFQGKSGQKLSELQSKYKNDKRFALDKRFIDAGNEDETEPMKTEESSEENLVAERKVQLKILEDVLGKKITPSKSQCKKESDKTKAMLRFDPSQPEHSNLELIVLDSEGKKRKNKKERKKEMLDDVKPEPEVSKEVFYKVTDNLKETFEEKQQFSLLSMFGQVQENKDENDEENKEKKIKRAPLLTGQNPFKYDSSDDDEDIPHKDQTENTIQNTSSEQKTTRASPAVFWTEPFFFKTDDFRLQEGLDFIEKIKTENKEFVKIRRDLKGIVRAKVRNNERKNKMFKKKLGGSKRRKHIRIKKALKR